jgi:NAD(P)-dependent dehydrogenase (short-subunit alcohol dehydrogenase family)
MTTTRKWTAAEIPDQSGKTFVVTGANSGLGYETLRAVARKGADTILACRDIEKGRAARERISCEIRHASIDVMRLDLANLASIQQFAKSSRRIQASPRPISAQS